MKVKTTKMGKDGISVEIEGAGHTLANMLRETLWDDKTVTSAAYEKRHPYLGHPNLMIKGKNPEKSLKNAVKRAKDTISEFRTDFNKAVK